MVFRFERVLLQYIKNYQNAKAQLILEQADDPYNLMDNSGNCLLHYAAKFENIAMTKYLIGRGTRVDAQNKNGETPLIVAMKHCDSVLIPLLLIEANADIFVHDKAGNSPLELNIIRFMNYELWKKILEKLELKFSFDYNKITNLLVNYGCNLQDVMFVGCSEVTKVMLQRGYDVNQIDDIGRAALHGAVTFTHLENVKLLIEHGADVNLLNSDGLTPVAYFDVSRSNANEKLEILKTLMDAGAKIFIPEKTDGEIMQMRNIFRYGSKEMIRLIMQYDHIDFNTKNEVGMTLLHVLAHNCNPRVFDELRGKKFNANIKNDENCTPLQFALENPSSVKFLLDHGAEIDATNSGFSIISLIENLSDELLLSDKFYADIVILFLQHGADVDTETPDGVTMFDAAVDYDRLVLIKPVLAHLALQKVIGKPLSALASQRIEAHEKLKDRFDFYVQQVEKMKAIAVCQSITLYNLLTESVEKIAVYMRNKKLVLKLSRLSNKCGLTNYYRQCLRKNLTEAIRIARLKEGAAMVLCKMIQQFSSVDAIIVDKIIDYIGLEDMKKLYYVY